MIPLNNSQRIPSEAELDGLLFAKEYLKSTGKVEAGTFQDVCRLIARYCHARGIEVREIFVDEPEAMAALERREGRKPALCGGLEKTPYRGALPYLMGDLFQMELNGDAGTLSYRETIERILRDCERYRISYEDLFDECVLTPAPVLPSPMDTTRKERMQEVAGLVSAAEKKHQEEGTLNRADSFWEVLQQSFFKRQKSGRTKGFLGGTTSPRKSGEDEERRNVLELCQQERGLFGMILADSKHFGDYWVVVFPDRIYLESLRHSNAGFVRPVVIDAGEVDPQNPDPLLRASPRVRMAIMESLFAQNAIPSKDVRMSKTEYEEAGAVRLIHLRRWRENLQMLLQVEDLEGFRGGLLQRSVKERWKWARRRYRGLLGGLIDGDDGE